MRPHRPPPNPVQIQDLYDERELSLSTVINFEYFPPHVLDYLDEIYTHRHHQRCMTLTYLTLLSMTCPVIIWMIYWMVSEHCQLQENSFVCPTVFLFQMFIFVSLGFIPIFFILMVISWTTFACSNPFDRIRKDFIGFRLEGIQWEKQLNDYLRSCCSSRKRQKLLRRNFGYIILSPYGIILDELFLLTCSKRCLRNGILIENGRILKLELNKSWIKEIRIYLPEQTINEELKKIFKLNMSM